MMKKIYLKNDTKILVSRSVSPLMSDDTYEVSVGEAKKHLDNCNGTVRITTVLASNPGVFVNWTSTGRAWIHGE